MAFSKGRRKVRAVQTVLEQHIDDLADLGAGEDLGQGHGQGKSQSPARRTMPPHMKSSEALDDHAVDAQDGESAQHVDGDAVWDEVAVDNELAEPRHKSQGEHTKKGEERGAQVPRQRCCHQKEQGGQTSQSAQAAVDEFNPRVGSVERGVVVFEVGLPLTAGALHVKVARHKCVLGHPQGVVLQQHAALVVLRTRRPCDLRRLRGRHEKSKALGPVWAAHAASRHAHHAAGQDHEEGQPKRRPRQRKQPSAHGCNSAAP